MSNWVAKYKRLICPSQIANAKLGESQDFLHLEYLFEEFFKQKEKYYVLFAIPKGNNVRVSSGNNISIFRHLHGAWNRREV